MTPAPYPLEVALKLSGYGGPRDPGGYVYELHPVVGWAKDGAPLVLHWETGRALPFGEFLTKRDPTGEEISSWTFRTSRQKVDADHHRDDHILH